MKAVVQRVKHASVSIDGTVRGEIDGGLMVLFGAGEGDTLEMIPRFAQKVAGLRIFSDEAGKMNLSAADLGLGALIVPNFTLYANTKKGYRPSFVAAAEPEFAKRAFEQFVQEMRRYPFTRFGTGEFGAEMLVDLQNDGPVTIILDTAEWGNQK